MLSVARVRQTEAVSSPRRLPVRDLAVDLHGCARPQAHQRVRLPDVVSPFVTELKAAPAFAAACLCAASLAIVEPEATVYAVRCAGAGLEPTGTRDGVLATYGRREHWEALCPNRHS